MDKPTKISVIIPCFNQGHFLAEAIESVRSQDVDDSELIVVNDGSTDNTSEVAARYLGLRYLYQSNLGLSAARNSGFRNCNGEFVVFLDSDDRLAPGSLESGLRALNEAPQAAFAFGRMQVINEYGRPLWLFPEPRSLDRHYVNLLMANYIPTPGMVMFRRKCIEKYGEFDTELKACEDYDFYLRIVATEKIVYHPSVTVERRMHGAQMTENPGNVLKYALRVLRKQYPNIATDHNLRKAYRNGRNAWRIYYGRKLIGQIKDSLRDKKAVVFLKSLYFLLRYCPIYPWYKIQNRNVSNVVK